MMGVMGWWPLTKQKGVRHRERPSLPAGFRDGGRCSCCAYAARVCDWLFVAPLIACLADGADGGSDVGHTRDHARSIAIIRATLPDGHKAKLRPDGRGGYQLTLPNGVLDRLEPMRGPARPGVTSS
jgi:hypothetical protein